MSSAASGVRTRPRDPDTFDIVATFRAVTEAARYHRMLILATAAITVALAALYAYVWPPIYTAEALIMAEAENDAVRDSFYANWNVFRKDSARTELELMMSGSLLKRVIEREKLTYDDVYHPFMSHLSYLWEESPPGRAYKRLKGWIFGAAEEDDFDESAKNIGRTIDGMRAGLQILPIGESMVGRITLKGPTRRVSDVVNTLLKTYSEMRGERHRTEASLAFESLTIEVEKSRKEFAELSARRVSFLERNALLFDMQKETQEVKTLSELESSEIATRQRVLSLEATLRSVEQALAEQSPTVKLSTVTELNALRENASMRRMELLSQLILTGNRYRSDSPEVAELRGSIEKFEGLIAATPERKERGSTEGISSVHQQLLLSHNSLNSDLAGARASLQSLNDSISKLRAVLKRVPALQDELRLIDRLYGVASEKFQALLTKRSLVEVSMATATATSPSLRVVDYAVPPASRSWPRAKILYPAALFVGLFLGLMAAQVRRLAGGRVRLGFWGRRNGDAPVYGSVAVPTTLPVSLVSIALGDSVKTSQATGY